MTIFFNKFYEPGLLRFIFQLCMFYFGRVIVSFILFVFFSSITFANNIELSDQYRMPTPPILIFVSLSMPKKSLELWMEEARKINAPLFIRGLIHNSFRETASFIKDLLKEKSGGFLIDPLQFKRYSVVSVPTVIVHSNQDWYSVSGDVHLDYALESIAHRIHSLDIQNQLTQKIKILRGQNYE